MSTQKVKKVAGYRSMLGMTQKEIAEYLGISSQNYSNKENSRTSFNDREKVKLKKLFSEIDETLTIDDIFFWHRILVFSSSVVKKWRLNVLGLG